MSVSLRELARRTGLSMAAVSQGLKGKGRLSPATREKIHLAAKVAGYQPDPVLSQAFSRMRKSRAQRYRETLGFIMEWETKNGPDYQKILHAAALEKAANMGYKLEEFAVLGKPSEHRRLSQVLRARGIRGLILLSRLGSPHPRLNLEWEHFAAVEIGRTLWHPRGLHRVESGGYQKVLEALHLLKKVGYRRIGMAVEPNQNKNQHGIFYAAFLLSQLRQPARQRIPIYDPNGPWTEKTFRQWFLHNKPDVLFLHRMKTVSGWLAKMGLRIPQDISIFCTNVQDDVWSGLSRNYAGLGSSAVEMVSLLLESGSLGIPPHSRSLQLDEIWRPGTTLSRPIAKHISESVF
jgi:LacI family transcriptional regulator